MSADTVTMDKIVSLARRRGFVFPSSEIYGGLGSSYDYGHYGVLLKDNVKARWLAAMVQERDDILALDSSIILHPRVWEVSGHVGGFTDPLVDCRFCKQRFRADHLSDLEHEEMRCGKRPSKRPGETPDCDLTEARQFNLMFETRVGAVEETGTQVYLRPETAQGIFINYKNVLQIARRKPPFGIAQVGKSFRNEITPGNFIFRTLEFEQMEMEFFVPPAEAEEWYRYWVDERVAWHTRYGLRESHLRVRPHDADELSHYSRGTSDIEYLFPMGWSELEGVANRGDYDLTQHTEASGTKLEWVGQDGERYTPHVIEPALGVNRSMLTFMLDAYDEEIVAERERTVLRLHPQLAPVKAAVLPLVGKSEDMVSKARSLFEELRARRERRVRRQRRDRPALPAPGRDRDAVRAHDRRADARGRHGHDPRPRLARAGANPARRRTRLPARPALAAVADAQTRLAPRTLEQTLAGDEAELGVELVRVLGVQHPAVRGERAFLDAEPDELDSEALAAMVGQDVDVREVGQPRIGHVDRAGETHLRAVEVDTDDPVRALDQAAHRLPRATGRPVRLLGDEAVHLVEVDPGRVVVELVAAGENLPHK